MYNRPHRKCMIAFCAAAALTLTLAVGSLARELRHSERGGTPLIGTPPRTPLQPAQLEPVDLAPGCQLELELSPVRLAGRPEHVLSLSLRIVLNDPAHLEAARALEPELQACAAAFAGQRRYSELSRLPAMLLLRENLLALLNSRLPPGACAREIYLTNNRLQ